MNSKDYTTKLAQGDSITIYSISNIMLTIIKSWYIKKSKIEILKYAYYSNNYSS